MQKKRKIIRKCSERFGIDVFKKRGPINRESTYAG